MYTYGSPSDDTVDTVAADNRSEVESAPALEVAAAYGHHDLGRCRGPNAERRVTLLHGVDTSCLQTTHLSTKRTISFHRSSDNLYLQQFDHISDQPNAD